MLLKIDIEKAYDALEWNTILATLTLMNFPACWIDWIKAYLTSISYSFLINGKPSDWINIYREVRQGDPISPYLFLLVSNNLSAILNHALNLDMVPTFDRSLSINFNHLMFADYLIIVTHTSRKASRGTKLYLDIYSHLTS